MRLTVVWLTAFVFLTSRQGLKGALDCLSSPRNRDNISPK